MYLNKSKFIAGVYLQFIFISMIFISSCYKDFLLDMDGIKIFSIACFVISFDMCIYVYKKFIKDERIKKE